MKNIDNLQKYRTLENFALDQTEQFFRPRTFLDMVYLFILVFWWISAVLFSNQLLFRASLFVIALSLFFTIPIYGMIVQEDKTTATLLNRAIKLLIFFILITILASANNTGELWDTSVFPISYYEVERTIVCILVPAAILMKSLSLETLQLGYSYYIGRIFQGYWSATLVLFIFMGIKLYIPFENYPIDLELLLLIAYGVYILGSLLPGAPPQLEMNVTTVFNQFMVLKSRTERFRDSILSAGVVLLLFLWLPQWLITYREIFEYLAFIGIAIGIILLAVPRSKTQNGYSSLVNALSDRIIDPQSDLGNRVQNFAKTIRDTDFQKPEQVYTIPTDGLKLISKGKSSLKAKKGALAIPTVTEKGTALVLMGKSEMEMESDEEEQSMQEIDGTTTLWLPRDEWENVKIHLNPKDTQDLTQTDLEQAGVKSITEVYDKALSAFNDLKSWRGPKGIFSSVFDPKPTKYSITETQDYSRVRLPGVYIFESKELEIVNILGGVVKIIEIKGVGEYVQILGGFVTVMETPDYSFVQTPFVSVIETPKGEIVRVFGINIQEGEKFDLEEARQNIIDDQQRFDSFFSKQIDSIFKEDPRLLFTNSKGTKMGYIVGEDEFIGDLKKRSTKKAKHKIKRKIEFPAGETSSIKKVKLAKPFKPIEVHKKELNNKVVRSSSPNVITLNLDEENFEKKMSKLDLLEKELEKIDHNIDRIDEKFLNDEISETKHTEMISRLKDKKEILKQKKTLIQKDL